jgi:hypothetical protein
MTAITRKNLPARPASDEKHEVKSGRRVGPAALFSVLDDARLTKNETLIRRGKKWFRYDAPDKQLFKQLQKTLTAD